MHSWPRRGSGGGLGGWARRGVDADGESRRSGRPTKKVPSTSEAGSSETAAAASKEHTSDAAHTWSYGFYTKLRLRQGT